MSSKGESPKGPEVVIELDSKKQIKVHEFLNTKRVDIREYYTDKATQEKKPSKKGISLSEDAWRALVANIKNVDAALSSLDKKEPEIKSE